MKRCAAVLVVLALCVAGCGYTTSSLLPSSIRTVGVEQFKNEIVYSTEGGRTLYFPLLEVKARDAVMGRFQVEGHLKIAPTGQADYVLKGRLVNYQRDALRYDNNDNVQEYRVRVIMSLEMYNRQTDTLEWTEPAFAGEATYFLTGSQARSEEAAVNDAVLDLARRIVERTLENW
jgi:hypothetical protein